MAAWSTYSYRRAPGTGAVARVAYDTRGISPDYLTIAEPHPERGAEIRAYDGPLPPGGSGDWLAGYGYTETGEPAERAWLELLQAHGYAQLAALRDQPIPYTG